jgi:hypothetical protein
MKHMKTLDRSLDTPKAKLAIKYLPFFLSSSQSAEQKTEKNAVLLLNQGRLNIALLLVAIFALFGRKSTLLWHHWLKRDGPLPDDCC